MVILSPSATALQKLLDICSVYSEKHAIVYNVKKSVFMVINSAKYKITNFPEYTWLVYYWNTLSDKIFRDDHSRTK